MMKKMGCFVLALVLCAALAGCASSGSASFSEEDLVLTVGGNDYRCRDNIETVIADMGDGYTYAEGKSCNYDGLDKTYSYPEATFYTNPLEEGDMLSEIYSVSSQAATSKDITVGADKQAVLDAYGEPAEQDDYLMIYRASEENGAPALCFELEGEKVTAIFLTVEPV